jgi:hypothetical protein
MHLLPALLRHRERKLRIVPVHRIRLLGPWEYAWEGAAGSETPPVTVGTTVMPCDWHSLFGPVAGTATFRRRFHRPTNLELHERVWLACAGVRGRGSVSLNEARLCEFASDGGAVEVEVTTHLQAFNLMTIRLSAGSFTEPQPGGVLQSVALEIRSE